MADYTTVMSEVDVSALKDTLCAQQKLLQKLYNELDAEREASATAASESLSVILRLQGEKAAVKLEAEQYKRLSEEKICHAEESLAIIEDVIYQKEMEVAALDHQLQAYRYKLFSMGCLDPGLGQTAFHDNILQIKENLAGEMSLDSMGRRHSAPVASRYTSTINEKESSGISGTCQKMYDQTSDSDKNTDNSTSGSINSYSEQIRELDERVKEITRSPSSLSSHLQSETRSPSPEISISNSYQPNKEATVNDKSSANLSRIGVPVDYSCSSSIDVFEVPQVDEKLSSYESLEKDEHRTACQSSGRREKDEAVYPEAVKMYAKVMPTTSDIQIRLHQVNTRSEIIEVEKPAESTNRVEELKLLKEIKEQLNSLQDEIRSWKVKKSSTRDEPSLSMLSEAMLYFWL